MPRPVVSIGYEGRTVEEFVSALRTREVEVVADVRLNAVSRKRGFSKGTLDAALAAEGIEYIHLPELGNATDNRAGYATTEGADADRARAAYRAHLAGERAAAALDRLRSLARELTVAVLCFEADERHCHRQQVVEALKVRWVSA